MEVKDLVFVGSTCTQDYLNWHYGLKSHMFSSSSMLLDDFIYYIKNRDKLIYEMGEKTFYFKTKFNKRYWYFGNNKRLGVRDERTFTIKYGFENTDRKIEVLYRHYEFNPENYFKVKKRVRLSKNDSRTPFFILSIGDGKEPNFNELLKEFLYFPYEYKLAIVKPDVDIEEGKYVLKTDKLHEELMPIAAEHLKKYFGLDKG